MDKVGLISASINIVDSVNKRMDKNHMSIDAEKAYDTI